MKVIYRGARPFRELGGIRFPQGKEVTVTDAMRGLVEKAIKNEIPYEIVASPAPAPVAPATPVEEPKKKPKKMPKEEVA